MAWQHAHEPVVTEYTFEPFPEGHSRHGIYAIQVRRVSGDRWEVRRGPKYMAADGTWGMFSGDIVWDDDWVKTHWFPLAQAMTLADLAADLTDEERAAIAASDERRGWLAQGA